MKYKTVKIPGHPRSGSHWINRLIDMNFFDGSDYLRHYGGHPWGNGPRADQYLAQKGQAVIYTWRSRPATIKSIYNMRHRFGLDENNFEKFQTRTMADMFNPNVKAATVRDTVNKIDNINVVDTLFKGRKETVDAYISRHFLSWFDRKGTKNFLMVQYDEMASDFDGTMLKIAKFLGSNKTEFIDENNRIGWRAKSDNAWTKP